MSPDVTPYPKQWPHKKPKKPRKPLRSKSSKPAELVASEAIVWARCKGNCEAVTPWCEGPPTQCHHIAGRSDHRPESLLAVCGSGNVTGCHGYIHQHSDESRDRGWMLSRHAPVAPHVRDAS